MGQQEIPLASLVVSTLNTRKNLDSGQEDSNIAELARSIKIKGLISPLTVRPTVDGKYEVLAGQRRLLACQQIGLDPVPCVVRENIDDNDATTISLIENVHRADMHPLDKARAVKRLYAQYGSYEQVASQTAWSVTTIRKYCKLLDLPPQLQERIATTEGATGISVMARLASTFKGEQAVEAFERIAGFRGGIQEELLKRSNGDIEHLDELRQEAIDGAFDVRHCGGKCGCEVIRDIIDGELDRADFETLVSDVSQTMASGPSSSKARKAARDLWKMLAKQ